MKIDNQDIYEQIGNLFYSIAADQHIKPLEVAELKLLISKDWLPRNLAETESIVSDETHYILVTMDTLETERVSAKDAFREFQKFYTSHPEVFTKEIKQRLLDTALEITKLFRADNPFENQHLLVLRDILGLNEVKTTVHQERDQEVSEN